MKAVFFFLIFVASGGAQLIPPKKGWRLLEKGEEVTEGKRSLGVWENEEKTATVNARWLPEVPDMVSLLGLAEGVQGIDSSDWPEKAEVFVNPQLSLRIKFKEEKNRVGGMLFHFWYPEGKGGVFVKVSVQKGAEVEMDGWKIEGMTKDESGEKQKTLEALAKKINAGGLLPLIEIEESVKPPTKNEAKDATAMTVDVLKDGVIRVEGELVEMQKLLDLIKLAAEEVPEGVLRIRAEQGVEFRFVRKILKIGVKAGIEKVAYTLLNEE